MNSLLSIFSSNINNFSSSLNSTQFVHDTQSFLLLLSHIEEITWPLIKLSSSSDNSILIIHHTYIDLGDRSHDLYIDIPQRWPNERPRCRTNLPVEFNIETWCPKTSRLIEIINNFHSVIDSLQSFWTQLTDLERDAIVLDEKPISNASTTRRLKINDNVHIQIQIDPYNPCAFPSITFHGPSMLIRSFDERLEQNRNQWTEAHSNIILNLEHMLDITFPSNVFFKPNSQTKDDQQQECGICYESTIDTNETIIYCETENCFKQYHEKCWKSWLRKKVPQRSAGDVLDIVVDERINTTTANGLCLFFEFELTLPTEHTLDDHKSTKKSSSSFFLASDCPTSEYIVLYCNMSANQCQNSGTCTNNPSHSHGYHCENFIHFCPNATCFNKGICRPLPLS